MFLIAFVVMLVVAVAYALQHRTAHVAAGTGQLAARRVWPTSGVGVWSLWAMLVAAVFPLGLSAVIPYTYAGAPLGAIAFVLALVAVTRYHDRSRLLLLPLLLGLFEVIFPILFVLLQPA